MMYAGAPVSTYSATPSMLGQSYVRSTSPVKTPVSTYRGLGPTYVYSSGQSTYSAPVSINTYSHGYPVQRRSSYQVSEVPVLSVLKNEQVLIESSPARATIGSEIPNVELDFGFPPQKVNIAERCKGKRVIIVGLPGAFTPT